MLRAFTRVVAAAGATTGGVYLATSRGLASRSEDGGANVAAPPAVRPLVLSGPSGVGKSTIIKAMNKKYPDTFGFSVSHTTRGPRPGEEDGVDYHFTTTDAMVQGIAEGAFIESATFSGNMYGTSYAAVRDVMDAGKICVLDVELQGTLAIRASDLNARVVVVFPPNMDVLEERLRARGTESEESIQLRLKAAKEDMAYVRENPVADLILVNDDLNTAVDSLLGVVQSDIHRIQEWRATHAAGVGHQ